MEILSYSGIIPTYLPLIGELIDITSGLPLDLNLHIDVEIENTTSQRNINDIKKYVFLHILMDMVSCCGAVTGLHLLAGMRWSMDC
jgi:hypothetical protein